MDFGSSHKVFYAGFWVFCPLKIILHLMFSTFIFRVVVLLIVKNGRKIRCLFLNVTRAWRAIVVGMSALPVLGTRASIPVIGYAAAVGDLFDSAV